MFIQQKTKETKQFKKLAKASRTCAINVPYHAYILCLNVLFLYYLP